MQNGIVIYVIWPLDFADQGNFLILTYMSKLKPENLEILTRKKMYVKEDIWRGRYIFRGRKIQSLF